MTTLTTTAQSFKKLAPIILFVVITVLLIGLIFYRLTKKPETPPPESISPPQINQDVSQKQPASFDFDTLEIPNIPEELPVYKATPFNVSVATAKSLAAKLEFAEDSTRIEEQTVDGKQYSWNKNDKRLTISQTNIIYRNNLPINQSSILQIEELEAKVYAFIASVLPTDRPEINKSETQYLSYQGDKVSRAGSFENSQIVEFLLGKKLSGIELVDDTPESTYTTIRIRKDGEVIFMASRFFDQFTPQSTYKIKSAKEAIDEIKNGQGKVVRTQIVGQEGYIEEFLRNQPENIPLATLTSLRLAYFLPDDITESIQPIFVFEGSFKTNKNENGKVVIYLPAIKQTK